MDESQKSGAGKKARAYSRIEVPPQRKERRSTGEVREREPVISVKKITEKRVKEEKLPKKVKQKVKTDSPPARRRGPSRRQPVSPPLKITPLGGVEEVGKNMTLVEYGGDMLIIDCGLGFPDNELFGIDIVIPDFTYAADNKDRIRGLIITHGHEDHIGAIPYFLRQMNVPVYGTKLTMGLVETKLKEHGITADLRVIIPGEQLKLGCFTVEPIHVNHSIPDAVAYLIDTPAGAVVHTGDFKIDYTPIVDDVIDLRRFGEIGSKGVLLMMSDSTNAERFGTSVSERVVGDGFERLFAGAEGKRVVIATFASNIQRVQQIVDLAVRHGRKIAICGRSMENYTGIAAKLGYLSLPKEILIDISEVSRFRAEDVIIVTTGSQGEPMSALSRMAGGTHRQISINSDDFVIISATPVPGNEKTVTKVINELLKLGSTVIYESMYDVHASGHACRDDLKLMLNLIKPKYFVPVHGEYKHLIKHRNLALSMGVPDENIMIPAIGQTIEVSGEVMRYGAVVPSGRVLVDGLGVGDVGSAVLRDRKHLSQDGLIVVVCSLDEKTGEMISGPDLISRGFVFVRESEELFGEARLLVRDIVGIGVKRNSRRAREDIKLEIREELGKLMYKKTKRSPMILPIIMEI